MPKPNEQAALARLKALRKKTKPFREISEKIASEFQITLPAMSVNRILDRTT